MYYLKFRKFYKRKSKQAPPPGTRAEVEQVPKAAPPEETQSKETPPTDNMDYYEKIRAGLPQQRIWTEYRAQE